MSEAILGHGAGMAFASFTPISTYGTGTVASNTPIIVGVPQTALIAYIYDDAAFALVIYSDGFTVSYGGRWEATLSDDTLTITRNYDSGIPIKYNVLSLV